MFARRVGHVPFRSTLTHDDKKGIYVVSGKFNGVEVVGTGTSERLAALNLKQQLNDAKLPTKG